jgi:Lrp/AsnC family leucine-responsive transcriptional regulator
MYSISSTDLRILKALQINGRMSNVSLAERIGMAPSPCLRRVRQLEEHGLISRYVALLDQKKMGFGLVAYVEVKVPQIIGKPIVERFNEAVMNEPAIIGCYITAGQFDYLLKVVAKDMDAYAKLVQTTLLKLPGVTDTRSTFVMQVVKDTTQLPL